MERRIFLTWLSGGAAALLVTRARSVLAADEQPAAIVPIVAPSLGIKDIPMSTLRRAFRGEVTEANGKRLVPFNYAPDNAVRRAFDQAVLGLDPDEVGRYWIDRRIRGQGMPPRLVPSQLIARAVVARLPGAICYVTADYLDDSVQALEVDGKRHTDAGFPIRMR